MISSGLAVCPDWDTTIFSRSLPLLSAVADGGRVDGSGWYVYGRVGADGSEMKGETDRGIWASKGCGPETISRKRILRSLLLTIIIHERQLKLFNRRSAL